MANENSRPGSVFDVELCNRWRSCLLDGRGVPVSQRAAYLGSEKIRTGMSKHFDERIYPDPNTGCHIWLGKIRRDGYGEYSPRIEGKRKFFLAHKFAYEKENGSRPENLVLDHLCRNRSCVNPKHLEPVSIKENIRRGVNAKREKTHCRHGHKYTPENIYWITPKTGRGAGLKYRVCKTCRLGG